MYKTILVPIDVAHSEESKAIIDMARHHADDDSRIIILNVVEEIPKWAAVSLPAGMIAKNMAENKAALAKLGEGDGRIEVMIREGHSYDTILDVCNDLPADLVIIASHRPELQDYFLGSTAARVVRHAQCSVLVVR